MSALPASSCCRDQGLPELVHFHIFLRCRGKALCSLLLKQLPRDLSLCGNGEVLGTLLNLPTIHYRNTTGETVPTSKTHGRQKILLFLALSEVYLKSGEPGKQFCV